MERQRPTRRRSCGRSSASGSSLGITITAEGVENESDLACLKAEGCNEGQGYLFTKAQPQGEVLRLLKEAGRKVA